MKKDIVKMEEILPKDGGLGRMLRTLLILAVCFMVLLIVSGACAMFVGEWLPAESRASYLAQSTVQALIAFVGTAVATAWIATRNPLRFLGLSQRVSWRPFLGVVIVYLIGLPALNQIIYYNSLMQFPAWMHHVEEYLKHMEEINAGITRVILSGDSVGSLVSGLLIIGVLTGFGEELLFRGTLQRALNQDIYMKRWSIWLAAAVFSGVHLQFYGFVPRLLLGAFFGYLLYSTGSIWPGAFAHALNNSLVVVCTWLQNKGVLAGDPEKWGVAVNGLPWVALGSVVLLVIFFIYLYPRLIVAPGSRAVDSPDHNEGKGDRRPLIRF